MQIDSIEFGCTKSKLEDYMTTSITINGIDLKKKIQSIEHPQFAKKEICMENGCYEGIAFFIAFDNQNHFLCRTLSDYIYTGNRYALYDYKNSGILGDHSITCKITLESDKVIWHDFKDFSKIIPFNLDYGNLKFQFSLDQYCDAINVVRNAQYS